ncbi:hypothetical protein [Gryllotalpicola sp.]|uniref:hypothetical protein n=1 Tax=Gryllotalpicola sp. TaxID=1932787 RepID=UPI00261B6523|nr:hypothetical protein [Gryllotalpicola sp.]
MTNPHLRGLFRYGNSAIIVGVIVLLAGLALPGLDAIAIVLTVTGAMSDIAGVAVSAIVHAFKGGDTA